MTILVKQLHTDDVIVARSSRRAGLLLHCSWTAAYYGFALRFLASYFSKVLSFKCARSDDTRPRTMQCQGLRRRL